MKKQMKLFLGIVTFCFCALPFMNVKAATTVNDEASLLAALNGSETEIVLEKSFSINAPIGTSKDVTIDGAGNTITAAYAGGSGNQTILTSISGTLTLKNITLDKSPKYGVQAYNGGNVVLDNVTISNSKFGAVLVNGGTVTIKKLTMDSNAYGIEFGVGEAVTGTPALIMDGSIDAEKQTTGDVIYIDTDQVTNLKVENTETSAQKIALDSNKVVLTENGKTIISSNELPDETVVNVNGTENVVGDDNTDLPNNETTTPEENADNNQVTNPNTVDSILFIVFALLASAAVATFAGRKLAKGKM